MNLSDAHLQDLADDLDRFESTFDHLSERDGDEADELANVAAAWLDRTTTAINERETAW